MGERHGKQTGRSVFAFFFIVAYVLLSLCSLILNGKKYIDVLGNNTIDVNCTDQRKLSFDTKVVKFSYGLSIHTSSKSSLTVK